MSRYSMLALLFALTGCGPKIVELHQAAWDQFTIGVNPMQGLTPPLSTAPGSSDAVKFDSLKAIFQEYVDKTHLPGTALAVVIDGKLAFSTGFGVKRAGSADPITPHTQFRVASTSKLVTAIALETLVERGLLTVADLDRPVGELVDWFPQRDGADTTGVTIERLLAHTAAIPDESSLSCPATAHLDDYFRARTKMSLWAPPGEVYNYSNAGYDLVGAIVEDQSGHPFAEYVRDHVMLPAGMAEATYDLAAAQKGDFAVGHDSKGQLLKLNGYDCSAQHPAGGVITSVEDYAHLLEALMGDGVFGKDSVARLTRTRVLTQERPGRGYAAGLFTQDYKGVHVLAHTGGMPGYSAFFAMVPERRFAVVAFTNSDGSFPTLATLALDLFLDLPAQEPPNPHTDPATWSDYAGHYVDPVGALGDFQIVQDRQRLLMQFSDGPKGPIDGQGGVFWRDSDHHVRYFVTRTGVAKLQ